MYVVVWRSAYYCLLLLLLQLLLHTTAYWAEEWCGLPTAGPTVPAAPQRHRPPTDCNYWILIITNQIQQNTHIRLYRLEGALK